MKKCDEEKLLAHLGVVLYENLGEEYPGAGLLPAGGLLVAGGGCGVLLCCWLICVYGCLLWEGLGEEYLGESC